jgi:hypothetical protein
MNSSRRSILGVAGAAALAPILKLWTPSPQDVVVAAETDDREPTFYRSSDGITHVHGPVDLMEVYGTVVLMAASPDVRQINIYDGGFVKFENPTTVTRLNVGQWGPSRLRLKAER